jgi:sarcosine oxidase
VRVDAVVVGLGSMGAAAANRLAASGLRVLGLDRFDPPHGRGEHAGGSRIIRTAYMEGPEYVPLVRRAYELWRDLEAQTGETLLTVTGGVMIGRPDTIPVAGALATARDLGLAHEVLDAAEIRRRFPALTPADDEIGVFDEATGLVRPERAIAALLRLATAAGAVLRPGVTVEGWRAAGDGVTVTTGDGEVRADRLVLTAGAWSGGLTNLSVPLRVERRVQHYARADGHGVGELPVWIWQSGGRIGYGLPTVDGATKAAFHDGAEDAGIDPDVGADVASEAELAELRAWLRGRLPGLAAAPALPSKPCLYTLTPDTHFVLGPHPDHAGVVVACGFSGHGFKFAPVVGEILTDLVTTGTTAHSIGLFDPARVIEPSPQS